MPLELLSLQQAEFDLSLTGFPEDELLRLLTAPPTEAQCEPDAVPEPPVDPITQPGDLWQLGRHRLLCGDATKADDLARLRAEGQADLLLTDPPYNVGYEGKTADTLTIANDDMDPAASGPTRERVRRPPQPGAAHQARGNVPLPKPTRPSRGSSRSRPARSSAANDSAAC